jgi:hypothetical protein
MRGILKVGLAVILLAACAEPEKPKAEHPASQGDPERARALISQADDATKSGDFDKARQLLKTAETYADVPARAEIDAQAEETDNAEAESMAEEIAALTKKRECKAAVTQAAEIVGKGGGAGKFLPAHVSKPIDKCIKKLAADEESLVEARKLVDDEETQKALTPKVFKALQKEVLEAATQAIDGRIQPLVEKGDFAAASAAVEEMVKSGLAHDEDRDRVLEKLREDISSAVDELVEKASEPPKRGDKVDPAKAALAKIEVLIQAGWPDAKARPKSLAKKLGAVSFAIACRELRCNIGAVKKRWTLGTTGVHPVGDPNSAANKSAASAGATIKTGVAVWELATGGGMSLVAVQEPAKDEEGGLDNAARAAAALGWVASKDLRDVDTSEMLPPGDQLVGSRVWGPLREGDKNWELGRVVSVKGATAKVRRLADRVEVDVARLRLRFGVAKQGTKVLGFCSKPGTLEPALIDSVKDVQSELMDPQVTLSCLDADGKALGVLKEGQLGSVRMPPDWAPAH